MSPAATITPDNELNLTLLNRMNAALVQLSLCFIYLQPAVCFMVSSAHISPSSCCLAAPCPFANSWSGFAPLRSTEQRHFPFVMPWKAGATYWEWLAVEQIRETDKLSDIWSLSSRILPLLPLGAVGVAGMTLVVGLGVFENEAVGALQSIGALLHTVGPVFEVKAFYTLVWTLGV